MTRTGPDPLPALGICLEEYDYPYAVRFLPVTNDLQALSMAYMDIPAKTEPSGMTVVLMHGKAFGGYYFHNVIEALTARHAGGDTRLRAYPAPGASRPVPRPAPALPRQLTYSARSSGAAD
jgi:pimeloyl-ACP methyl ester carboxylesterase